MSADKTYDLIIAGGGAAGFFSAIRSAEQNPKLKILILEKSAKLLSKVLVSGGGRCNVTHHCLDPKKLSTHYPRGGEFLLPNFWAFGVQDTIDWFEQRKVALKVEADGRMFPTTDSSETIADALINSAKRAGIEIRSKEGLVKLNRENGGFQVETEFGSYGAKKVVLAFGGLPKRSQYGLFDELGITIVDPCPSLFTFNLKGHPLKELSGISVPRAEVDIQGIKHSESGPLLITHWGISGPAVLKTSAWLARELADKSYQFNVTINWLGQNKESTLEQLRYFAELHPKKQISSTSPFEQIPLRLWAHLCGSLIKEPYRNWAESGKKLFNALGDKLCKDSYFVEGKTTFKEEFVTAGGVDLEELDDQFMLKKVPGLFVVGELVNIDGVTGGFNFQAAWTAGDAVGRAMRK